MARIAESEAHLKDVSDLGDVTNDRIQAENDLLPGIGSHELVFGIPSYRVINAAFTHAHPLGGRFNGPSRGAWYSAFSLATAKNEASYHKSLALAEIARFEDAMMYDEYVADFSATFADLRNAPDFAQCLAPNSYVASQQLAQRLLEAGSLGVVYPSVRHRGGTWIGCFRPALVNNVRKRWTYSFVWKGHKMPTITLVSS